LRIVGSPTPLFRKELERGGFRKALGRGKLLPIDV
jgi:hypothetical protein